MNRTLAGITVVTTYALIILGGWVRANNAGLSCPDWPTCYGQWVLTPSEFAALGDVGYSYYEMMLEWVHRFMAAFVVGPLILALAFIAWRQRKVDAVGFRLGLTLLVILGIQGTIGGLTVIDRNSPWSVALHLSTALILFSILILVRTRAAPQRASRATPAIAALAGAVWVVAIATMATAAMTAKSGASLACYNWPSCDGRFFPDLDDPLVLIHFLHRKMAVTTGIGIMLVFLAAQLTQQSVLARHAAVAAVLVCAQVALGAVVILLEVPQWSQIAHQALGVLLLGIVARCFWIALRGLGDDRRSVRDAGLRHA